MALILVVDDSPTARKTIAQIIESAGYHVVTASSGREAIDITPTINPDLIVMDVMMENMNGFEATRTLSSAEETAQIPIIIVSSRSGVSDKKWGLRQGARDYIVKSDDKTLHKTLKNDLLNSVKKILNES